MAKPRKRPAQLKKTLNQLIADLPSPDIESRGLKELVLQYITEVPLDDEASHHAAKTRCKLEALRLLNDIIRTEDAHEYEDELISVLQAENDEEY